MMAKIELEQDDYLLIVDDQIENLKVLDILLSERGYKVKKAINGETALMAAESKPPNLILLDIKMPDVNGYEVCRRLKTNPQLCDIPVIFISALDEVFNKVEAFQVGGCDYITKPFQSEEIIHRIDLQLSIQKQKHLLQQEIQTRADKEIQLLEEIRKRHEAEEILYQSRALLSSILNSSLDGIAALQAVRDDQGQIADFRCVVINPILARKINYQKTKIIGKLFLRKFLHKINPLLFEKFVQLVETGESLEQDLLYQDNTRQIWYHFIAVKLGDGFSLVIRDITERKQIELAMQKANEKLKLLASLDGLTNIANRRYFAQRYQQLWQRCMREKQPLSVILCDVDFFKNYNDVYGHLAGDGCLVTIAQTINKQLKGSENFVARYGGEEFVVVLPKTSTEAAIEVAENIQAQVKDLKIAHRKSPINAYVTLSIGIATITPTSNSLSEKLMDAADQSLYKAKQQGRNRIVIN